MIRMSVKEEMYIYDMYHIIKAFYPGSDIQQRVGSSVTNLIELEINEVNK